MEATNNVIRLVNQAINYVKEQSTTIAALLVFLYFSQKYLKQFRGNTLRSTTTTSMVDRNEAMRRARERQQEIANKRAEEFAEKEKIKLKETVPKKKKKTVIRPSGDRLGQRGGYNPLMPHTASGGPGYRPAKRVVRRA